MTVTLRFWGVRGSIPTPEPDNLGVGGETSCVELSTPGHILIIDAGTGIRRCGDHLLTRNGESPRDIWILLSHFHWDHLQGLPFFAPIYRSDYCLHFLHSGSPDETRERMRDLMRGPYFPVQFDDTPCEKRFHSLSTAGVHLGELEVKPVPLHHPQGATGYSIRAGSAPPIVYASDYEHGNPAGEASLRDAAAGAAALIYDAQYTPEEYERGGRRGWGHSTWRDGAQLAEAAGCGRLFLFHHDPSHHDAMMRSIQDDARAMFANTDVAVEGKSMVFG